MKYPYLKNRTLSFLVSVLISLSGFASASEEHEFININIATNRVIGEREFTNIATNRVLDSNNSGEAYTFPSNGTAYQKWIVTTSQGSEFTLQNKATNLYLDMRPNGSVFTQRYNGEMTQRWVLRKMEAAQFIIKNVGTTLFLGCTNIHGRDNLHSSRFTGSLYQIWIVRIEPQSVHDHGASPPCVDSASFSTDVTHSY